MLMKKSELEEGSFGDWAARQGFRGKANQLAATAKRFQDLSSDVSSRVFSDKLAAGLQSAIQSGMVDDTLAPYRAQQQQQQLQKNRKKKSQIDQGYAFPSTDASVNLRGFVYTFTAADKKWRTPQGKVIRGPQDIQDLNKYHYDAQQQSQKTAVPESVYSEFEQLLEQKLSETTSGAMSVAEWVVRFVLNEIYLEKLPQLDATGMNQLKNLAERFQISYLNAKPRIPEAEVKNLFAFLKNWAVTNPTARAQQNQSQDISDVLTATLRNLGTSSTDGSDNYSQLANGISKLLIQMGQVNPKLAQAIINSYNNSSNNP